MIDNPTVGMVVKSIATNSYCFAFRDMVGLIAKIRPHSDNPLVVIFRNGFEGEFNDTELEFVSDPSLEDHQWIAEFIDRRRREIHADQYL